MTTLILQPPDGSTDSPIRLNSGQSCTIGSSAAADFLIESDDLHEIHCRLSCHRRQSFIECFDLDARITINQASSNRSKLANGDLLNIGGRDFFVHFLASEAALAPPANETTETMGDSATLTVSIQETPHNDEILVLDFDNEDTKVTDLWVNDDSTLPMIDTLSLPRDEVADVGARDSEGLAGDSISEEKPNLPSAFLQGLVSRSRLEKKDGEAAVSHTRRLLESDGLNLYLVKPQMLRAASIENVTDKFEEPDGAVYLLSNLDLEELGEFLAKRRWHGRIRHPLGLLRFLELSPDVICQLFFSKIEGCFVNLDSSSGCEYIGLASDPWNA